MLTCSDLDVLTDDARSYALSFTLASTLLCLSMTSHNYRLFADNQTNSVNKTLDVLCCEEDDLELFQKLVAEGHVPTEKHITIAAESGSFHIYDFLRVTIPDLAEGMLLLEEMFDKYFACLDTIPLQVATAELDSSKKTCRDLDVDESNAEFWYAHHRFLPTCTW